MTDQIELTGKLLIAMPGMGDQRFMHSVIFMNAYSADGAMGLIINKPFNSLSLFDLLDQLSIDGPRDTGNRAVHFGGPVEGERGFVLHSDDFLVPGATQRVDGGFALTATQDVLEALSLGEGPSRAIIALGYSGWGSGQLESEIARNGWLTCDADFELVFDAGDQTKWEGCLKKLGISPINLSAVSGHA